MTMTHVGVLMISHLWYKQSISFSGNVNNTSFVGITKLTSPSWLIIPLS